jgi:hypothetical protein
LSPGQKGIVYEVDQRHAEIIVRQLGLRDNSNSVVTSGVKDNGEEEERKLEVELNTELIKMRQEEKAVEPTLQTMLENVEKSYFIDIIESKADVWQMN